MKNSLPTERGQALILITLAAIGIFAIVGLAIDGGAKFADQRHAQNAADTAALAGAYTLTQYPNDPYAWRLAAIDRAGQNGYVSNLESTTVTVYQCDETDADCGFYDGDSDYIRVVIDNYINTTFSRVIGIKQMHNRVYAVAIAKTGGNLFGGASFVAVNPSPGCSEGGGSGGGSFDVGGSGTINLHNGGIFVNSDETCGYSQTSCNATLTVDTAPAITSAGSGINLGGCASSIPTDTTKDQVLVPDEIFMPSEPDECIISPAAPTPLYGATMSDGYAYDWALHPGHYTDSSFPPTSLIGVNQRIWLTQGIYCLDRSANSTGVTWNGNKFARFTGTDGYGVSFYMKGDVGFNLNINSPITLTATSDPTSDFYGYLIVVDGNETIHPACTINGGSYLTLDGTIYAPYCDVTINGDNNSNSTYNVQVIGWNVKLNGNNAIDFYYDPDHSAKVKSKVGLIR